MRATKNYVYGAGEPDITDQVDAAIRAAHQLRNKLCELELEKRKRFYEMLARESSDYAATESAIRSEESRLGKAREAIQAAKKTQQTTRPDGVESHMEVVKASKASLRDLRAKLKSIRKETLVKPRVKQWLESNAASHKAACKEAEQESGLYWGTRALVRDSCRAFASGAPPRFARYSREGQLAVQLQGGLAAEDVTAPNTLCYIESDERKTYAYLRIGSSSERSPVFARVPITFHRPLPAGSRIKWAYLERRKMANQDRWHLRLTIDVDVDTDRDVSTWCAVHFGWKMEPSGTLRVAIWEGCDGRKGSISLSPEHLQDYTRLDEVKAERDNLRNGILCQLSVWLDVCERPEWMPHPKQIRSSARLAALVSHWIENRIPGDGHILEQLEQWRNRDKRRWQHSCRLSARIVRRRKNQYRVVAKQLSDRYGVLYAAKIEVAKLTENSQPEDMVADQHAIHRHARWAAPSLLMQVLQEKFPLHWLSVASKNLTRECHKCGKVCSVSTKHRTTQCTSCKSWDVDENALRNTIARGQAMQEAGELIALREKQESKEEMAAARLRKMQEANRKARSVAS